MRIYYRLADATVLDLLRCVQTIAARRLADARQIVRDYFEEPESLEPVAADDLLDRLRSDEVVVLDVRPQDEYAAAHLPGALSMPVDELERRLSELPRDREVVAYCRGPYCVLSVHALGVLRAHGFRARRLDVGLPDWRAAGLAVASGVPEASPRPFQEEP